MVSRYSQKARPKRNRKQTGEIGGGRKEEGKGVLRRGGKGCIAKGCFSDKGVLRRYMCCIERL